MNNTSYLDEAFRDLARDFWRYERCWPDRSQEYKIMMQDLSRGNAKTIVPDIEMSGRDMIQIRSLLHRLPPERLQFFAVFYLRRFGRAKKMKELGIDKKTDYYAMRDDFLAYCQGQLDAVDFNNIRGGITKCPDNDP